jgi:hypothetical protein
MKMPVNRWNGQTYTAHSDGRVTGDVDRLLVLLNRETGVMRIVDLDDDERAPALTINWHYMRDLAAAQTPAERAAVVDRYYPNDMCMQASKALIAAVGCT